MKVDTSKLLSIFDELMGASDEEQGVYWFKKFRTDNIIITFAFSKYESYIDIIIHNTSKVDIASLSFKDCHEIRIVDEKSHCLEMQDGRRRCFLSLLGSPILDYEN